MKDAEDEAFDDLARKQGAWGGGFPAKRQMAADKLHWSDCAVHNAPAYPAGECDCDGRLSKYAETLLEEATRSCDSEDEQRALDALMLDFHKPVQEPDLIPQDKLFVCGQMGANVTRVTVQPAQEPVARVTGVYGGRFTYEPLNRAVVLPIGMALYAGPPAQEPVIPLYLEWELGYPEHVASGTQRQMDRLKKWLDKYFALIQAQPAQEPEMLTIAYQSGYHDGKKAALAGREWNFCERCGKRTGDLSVIHTCTPPQGGT